MKPVYIQCEDVDSICAEHSTRTVGVELNMTRNQEKALVWDILSAWPEKAACDWLRSEFPEWFATTGEAA